MPDDSIPGDPVSDDPIGDDAGAGDFGDAARRMLARARAGARNAPVRRSAKVTPQQRSSARPDGRDPQTARSVLDAWLHDSGYSEALAAGGIHAHWVGIVGPDIAAHVTCETNETNEGRVLILRADSTAWATQVRLLLPDIRRRIEEVVGQPVTDPIRVVGPTPPKRPMGPRRVAGRGPRDTYG